MSILVLTGEEIVSLILLTPLVKHLQIVIKLHFISNVLEIHAIGSNLQVANIP